MARSLIELLEELEKMFPDPLDEGELIERGFDKKTVSEAIGNALVNYQYGENPTEPQKLWISDKGFLIFYQMQMKKSVEKLDDSIIQFNKNSTWLSRLMIILTIVIIGLMVKPA